MPDDRAGIIFHGLGLVIVRCIDQKLKRRVLSGKTAREAARRRNQDGIGLARFNEREGVFVLDTCAGMNQPPAMLRS